MTLLQNQGHDINLWNNQVHDQIDNVNQEFSGTAVIGTIGLYW